MKKFGKIIADLFVVIAVIIVLFFGAMIVLPHFDYGLAVIKSGSMEPTIKTGSAVIIKKQDVYNVGDVITFAKTPQSLVTHRIVAIDEADGMVVYHTKGDANESADIFPTVAHTVRGKVIFTIPFVGYGIAFLQSRIGIVAMIVLVAIYFIGREVGKIKKELKERRNKKFI